MRIDLSLAQIPKGGSQEILFTRNLLGVTIGWCLRLPKHRSVTSGSRRTRPQAETPPLCKEEKVWLQGADTAEKALPKPWCLPQPDNRFVYGGQDQHILLISIHGDFSSS